MNFATWLASNLRTWHVLFRCCNYRFKISEILTKHAITHPVNWWFIDEFGNISRLLKVVAKIAESSATRQNALCAKLGARNVLQTRARSVLCPRCLSHWLTHAYCCPGCSVRVSFEGQLSWFELVSPAGCLSQWLKLGVLNPLIILEWNRRRF